MIRKYQTEDREMLGDFFANILRNHKSYISHGEIQMGVATDADHLAPDFREKWLLYLDRQASNADCMIFLYEEAEGIGGFVIFGVMEDGADPYGLIYDLSTAPEKRGKGIGKELLQIAMKTFKEKGIKDCYLESGVDNHSAHVFFQHQGFDTVSHIFRTKVQ